MRIEFERSGGFAGLTLRASLELDDDPDGFEALNHLGTAQLDTLRDHFRYKLTVVEGEKRRTFTFTDVDVSPALWPLLDRLTRAALNQDL